MTVDLLTEQRWKIKEFFVDPGSVFKAAAGSAGDKASILWRFIDDDFVHTP